MQENLALKSALNAKDPLSFCVKRAKKKSCLEILRTTHAKHHIDAPSVENCGCSIGITYRLTAGLSIEPL